MALIEWRKEFCTGVPGVDYEHQELINEINSIFALIENNADKEDVLDSLGDIYGSISAHFALEEQMMEKHNYDHFKEHQADHERLLDDITQKQRRRGGAVQLAGQVEAQCVLQHRVVQNGRVQEAGKHGFITCMVKRFLADTIP